jgi:DNA repair protein RadC
MLYVMDGEDYKPALERNILEAARNVARRKLKRGLNLVNPQLACKHLPDIIGSLEHEMFCVIFLDKRHRLIEFKEMFRGTIDGASVHPREVVKTALELNAAAVICAHNHPSGNTSPSSQDALITSKLKESLAMFDIRLLDHLIATATDCYSMAEHGEV